MVDTCGLLLVVLVTGAHVQDRDAARLLLWALRTTFPTVQLLWADGGYSGQLVQWAAAALSLTVQIVRKLAGQIGFQVQPRRWVAERTFAWINRCRRTVRDYERLPAVVEASRSGKRLALVAGAAALAGAFFAARQARRRGATSVSGPAQVREAIAEARGTSRHRVR